MGSDAATHPLGPDGLVVLLCRGCCCGSPKKHPDVDHDQQEDELAAAAAAVGARVIITDCLDECARSNVVVLRRRERWAWSSSLWLGGVLDARRTAELCAYVRDGWPKGAPLPPRLAGMTFVPERERTRRRK